MKTKILVFSAFFWTISCGSSTSTLPSVQDALKTCMATQCQGQTTANVEKTCTSIQKSNQTDPRQTQSCNDAKTEAALICYAQNCNSAAGDLTCVVSYASKFSSAGCK